jgi:hypothetical protein
VCVLSAHLASVVQTFQDEIKQFVATEKTYARPIHQDADKIYHCLLHLTLFSIYFRTGVSNSN